MMRLYWLFADKYGKNQLLFNRVSHVLRGALDNDKDDVNDLVFDRLSHLTRGSRANGKNHVDDLVVIVVKLACVELTDPGTVCSADSQDSKEQGAAPRYRGGARLLFEIKRPCSGCESGLKMQTATCVFIHLLVQQFV